MKAIKTSMGGQIISNQFSPLQPPMAAKYVTNAVAEKVNEKAISACLVLVHVLWSVVEEQLIAARPTSHVIYHEKNQGVTTRSKANVASVARIMVCIVGVRHKQIAPILNAKRRAIRLITFQTV